MKFHQTDLSFNDIEILFSYSSFCLVIFNSKGCILAYSLNFKVLEDIPLFHVAPITTWSHEL